MTDREDIAAITTDGEGDKLGRRARLRARRLFERLENNLPHTWQPRANVSVIVKEVSRHEDTVAFVIDVTIRGVTKSLHEWIVGIPATPDWQIVNPPLFVDDPTGDVTIGEDVDARVGRDDFIRAMRQVFVDDFGAKIADILRVAQ